MMIAKIEAGSFHTIAVSLDRRHVYSCGQAAFGQCGLSKEEPAHDAIITKLQPVPFPEDIEVESVE
jgi:alpha-tubulin suppressor-like RCC1 family protein